MLVDPDEQGRSPAVIPRSVLRLMALVNIVSMQLAAVVGLGVFLAMDGLVPGLVARAGCSVVVAVGIGSTVFWRLGQKWGRYQFC